jgi:uncharacterized protein (TIGR02466 family)
MSNDMQSFGLFPTPVWVRQLEPEQAEGINRQAIDLIERLRQETPGINPGDRWQTATDLETKPELQDLISIVNEGAEEALSALRIEHNGFLVTGCWANIKPAGAGHVPHNHPNNYLSGVNYVRLPSRGGRILFHDPRDQPYLVLPRTTGKNEYNSRIAHLPIRKGGLILFPSWLVHSVENNPEDLDRISFNIMFKQFGEEIARPHWKHIPGS